MFCLISVWMLFSGICFGVSVSSVMLLFSDVVSVILVVLGMWNLLVLCVFLCVGVMYGFFRWMLSMFGMLLMMVWWVVVMVLCIICRLLLISVGSRLVVLKCWCVWVSVCSVVIFGVLLNSMLLLLLICVLMKFGSS